MEIKVNVKSILIGMVVGLAITLTVGTTGLNTQKSSESGPGRFKMLLTEKKAYILDSQTGQAWSSSSDARGMENREAFWKSKLEFYQQAENKK